MPGKRKETMEVREILRHLQQGWSDRALAKALGIDRKTVSRYRTWATEQGLMEGSLPHLTDLHRLVEETLNSTPPPQNTSSVEPFREVVVKLRQEGVEVATTCERLKEWVDHEKHGASNPQPADSRRERVPWDCSESGAND